jgi:hypothetical protein
MELKGRRFDIQREPQAVLESHGALKEAWTKRWDRLYTILKDVAAKIE